mmetsp:Transcript_73560/g.185443  ORF Transcript_73560/g.185443 Transcript_73560/m.185443 type:complete len:203 (-) Transcript_73560:749-1357(-)
MGRLRRRMPRKWPPLSAVYLFASRCLQKLQRRARSFQIGKRGTPPCVPRSCCAWCRTSGRGQRSSEFEPSSVWVSLLAMCWSVQHDLVRRCQAPLRWWWALGTCLGPPSWSGRQWPRYCSYVAMRMERGPLWRLLQAGCPMALRFLSAPSAARQHWQLRVGGGLKGWHPERMHRTLVGALRSSMLRLNVSRSTIALLRPHRL